MQNSPDSSGMASRLSCCYLLPRLLAIRTDSRTGCDDEAPDSSLLIKLLRSNANHLTSINEESHTKNLVWLVGVFVIGYYAILREG